MANALSPFVGNSVMAARCSALDWSATPLGPVERWSNALRTTVAILLCSRNPMFLFWGPDLVQIFNDDYLPSLGQSERQYQALGSMAEDFWVEIWDVIGPQIQGVMSRGEATWHEDQYLPIYRNGRMEDVWWTYSYSPVHDDDGTIGGTLVVCQETTNRVVIAKHVVEAKEELHRAADALSELEIQFRAVQDASPDASLLLKSVRNDEGKIRDFVFTYANKATETVLLGRQENVVGRTMREAFPESVAAGRLERYAKIVETGEGWLEDVHYTRGPINHGLRVSAVKVGDGLHLSAVDLTARIRAEEEREVLLETAEHARYEAENANRAKSQFLAVMSHELRTPLNAIDGYAELLELGIRGPVTEEQKIDLARIRKSQRHLLGLINGVLNYARVEAGAVHFAIEKCSVAEALTTCEALTAPQMRTKGLHFMVDNCNALLYVEADAEKLQQILLNLLTNAMKFTERGGSVSMICGPSDGTVAITVTDTGRGIEAHQLVRVFEPFVQIDAQLTRTQEGVGLGLAISRDLARGMGGDLTVTSEIHKGSSFTLTLRRVE